LILSRYGDASVTNAVGLSLSSTFSWQTTAHG